MPVEFRASARSLTRTIALAAGLIFAGAASAGPPILPAATINGSVGIGIAQNGAILSGPGYVTLPPAYSGDWGTASLFATLGSSPSIAVVYDSTQEFAGSGGGSGELILNYYTQYYNPTAAVGSTINATMTTQDTLVQSGSSSVFAQLFVEGPHGFVFLAQDCQSARNGCDAGANSSGGPFPASSNITLLQNVTYRINMLIQVSGYGIPPADGVANALIDPQFFAPLDGGGQFIFSDGVTGPPGVPEPASWALMIGAWG